MAATTAYQAGIEANNMEISYGVESVWGTVPAVAFQTIRLTSETLALNRTRARPLEINTTREASASVTTQESAGGALNFAYSYGTYDDLYAVALGNEFSTPLAISQNSPVDITITNLTPLTATLSSTTSGKFTTITLGQWIRIIGATNATNNGIWYVSAKASNTSLTLTGTQLPVTESGVGIAIRGSYCINSTEFRSLFIQKKYSSTKYLNYAGSFITGFNLQGQLGQFFNGSFNILSKSEAKSTSDSSTGAATAATTGRVINPVSGFMGMFVDNVEVGATIDQFAMTVTNTGAAAEYGLGASTAAGMLQGYLEVNGTFRAYFPDFAVYDQFVAEAGHNIAFHFQDNLTNAYVVSLLNGAFSEGKINAGGPGQPVYASFAFQGDPRTAGGTMQIDKLAYV